MKQRQDDWVIKDALNYDFFISHYQRLRWHKRSVWKKSEAINVSIFLIGWILSG